MSQCLTNCHSEPHVDLVQLDTSTSSQLLHDEAIRLIGAHGEEIVRSIYVDELVSNSVSLQQKRFFFNGLFQSGVIYSAGEDGHVTAFREEESQVHTSTIKQAKKGHKSANNLRFRPY